MPDTSKVEYENGYRFNPTVPSSGNENLLPDVYYHKFISIKIARHTGMDCWNNVLSIRKSIDRWQWFCIQMAYIAEDCGSIIFFNEVMVMQLYTLQQASADLGAVVSRTVRNHEEAAIVSDEGSVILVSQEEYEIMQETLRLLSDKRSLAALLAGHAFRDANQLDECPSVEQVFNDLQDSYS